MVRGRRSAGGLRPAEHPQRLERDPSTRLIFGLAEVDQQLVMVSMIEGPSAVGIAPGLDDTDGLGYLLVRGDASLP